MAYKYPSLRTTAPIAGYYARLDAGAAATDQFTADGSQDGTLTSGATRADDSGLAYSFDGVDDVVRTTVSAPTYPFSMSAWLKPSSLHAGYAVGFFCSGFNDPHFGLQTTLAGKVTLLAELAGQVTITSSVSYAANTWIHVAGVWTSATSRTLYVNGVADGTSSTSVTISANINRFSVGRFDRQTPVNHFVGLIDDVVRYNIALSATEVAYLASRRGAIYQLLAGSSPINGQSLIRPADSKPYQQLIGV